MLSLLFPLVHEGYKMALNGNDNSEQFQGNLSSSSITVEFYYTTTSVNFILCKDKHTLLLSGSELCFEMQ